MKISRVVAVCSFLFVGFSGMAAEESPIKLNALVQAWLFNDTVTTPKPNFRLRRAEVKVTAQAAENVKAFVMVDAAKAISTSSTTVVTAVTPATTGTVNGVNTSADTKILQDLGVAITLVPDLEVTLGQFKTPTTAEGLESSSELLLPERSIIGRTFGDKREPGGMISYKYSLVKTMLMVSNGQATNVDDVDNNKDLTLRVEAEATPDLKIGAFTQAANFSYGTRARHGLNIKWTMGDFLAKVEGVLQSMNNDSVKSNGFVVESAYKYDKWQPVVRFEYYKPVTSVAVTGKAFTLGVNYLINGPKVKVQAAMTNGWDYTIGTTQSVVAGKNGTALYLVFSAAI